MRMTRALLVLTGCVTTSMALAQTPGQILQAVTPDHYPSMQLEARQMYVAGVLDAERTYLQLSKPVYATCLNGVTIGQATDVVDKRLPTLQPELRITMPIAVHNALITACDYRG